MTLLIDQATLPRIFVFSMGLVLECYAGIPRGEVHDELDDPEALSMLSLLRL